MFCNSSFADPNSPNYLWPKSPKQGKGGLFGAGPAAHGLGAAALVGMSAVAVFFVYKHHKRRRQHNMQQAYEALHPDGNMGAPLLGAALAPPKYGAPMYATAADVEKGGAAAAAAADAPPGYTDP